MKYMFDFGPDGQAGRAIIHADPIEPGKIDYFEGVNGKPLITENYNGQVYPNMMCITLTRNNEHIGCLFEVFGFSAK